jgi:hypothetical protein
MTCSTCLKEIIPVEGVTCITQREYKWHIGCASIYYIDGKPVVDFPSDGKLMPKTIIE